ncbi:GntR family transcriptional regulator [Fodinibacter luteus]|uniref:GntR family transcriptional regulator n=1 Tax=Fodinibacter luteus TaxID=552064 RepID=A0ABP8KDV6_9MICO
MPNHVLAAALRNVPAATVQPSAAERVAAVLREQIVDGALRSGTRLTEETIGTALGFSRNTIREAFALLLAERLAVREPNRGVFVATPTAADVRDLYATRRLVEPAAVEHGPAFSDDVVRRLRSVVDAGHAALGRGDAAGVAQANQEFHRALARISGSRHVDQLMEGVLAEMRLVFHQVADDAGFHEPYLERNEAIVELLERCDRPGAAALLRDYLEDAEAHLVRAVRGTGVG